MELVTATSKDWIVKENKIRDKTTQTQELQEIWVLISLRGWGKTPNGFHFFMPINLSVDWNQTAQANKNITGLTRPQSLRILPNFWHHEIDHQTFNTNIRSSRVPKSNDNMKENQEKHHIFFFLSSGFYAGVLLEF